VHSVEPRYLCFGPCFGSGCNSARTNVPPHTLQTHCAWAALGTLLELLVRHFLETSLLQTGHFNLRGFPSLATTVRTARQGLVVGPFLTGSRGSDWSSVPADGDNFNF